MPSFIITTDPSDERLVHYRAWCGVDGADRVIHQFNHKRRVDEKREDTC